MSEKPIEYAPLVTFPQVKCWLIFPMIIRMLCPLVKYC